ncbi:hypothetical protein BV25DRAFT_1832228 [Artomyces pyxidatus]|uniref:Uncharacterized protein n=1 Tax=Artomyces pyxidatus TaxID=48021 RepID=A0ACB8SIQ5_9AGAM|nr:hypothetical protein BV25DRAFT_1832228 [Artomyces pyxidatus]
MDFEQILALPYNFDRDDEDSLAEHEDKLLTLRRKARERPLHPGVCFIVQLDQHDTPGHVYPPGARPLPSFAREPASRRLVLDTPLQTGMRYSSQVWIARVESSDNVEEADTARVVLKFIQPSMFYIPSTDDVIAEWRVMYTPPKILALREDYLYQEVKAIQGSAVPYYFGIHEVIMPNGEAAYMLVTEYIEGITLHGWKCSQAHCDDHGHSLLDPESHSAMLPGLQSSVVLALRSVKQLHDLDVQHGDLSPQNMILHPSGPSPSQVVLIDFARGCKPLDSDISMDRDADDCFEAFICCANHSEELEKWIPGNLPPDVVHPSLDDLGPNTCEDL